MATIASLMSSYYLQWAAFALQNDPSQTDSYGRRTTPASLTPFACRYSGSDQEVTLPNGTTQIASYELFTDFEITPDMVVYVDSIPFRVMYVNNKIELVGSPCGYRVLLGTM
jgi:hypothetical protein